MHRVAALFLPMWPIELLRRDERRASPEARLPGGLDAIGAAMAAEHAKGCSVPRGGGWRPGARWAREARQAAIDALPEHQRPPIRDLGRCDMAADHAFKRVGGAEILPGTGRVVEGPPPLVTSIRDDNRMVVAAACPQAQALGLTPGMPLTKARAQVAGLDIRPADPEGDRAELHRLAIALARRWAPSVTIAGDDTLFLDLTGVAHLYGGEARMVRRLVRMLARRGVTAHLAVADTVGAAWALAHHARKFQDSATLLRDSRAKCEAKPLICPPGRHAAGLAELPIEALRLEAKAVELLHRLGVTRIGQLTAMPRAPLVRRFGTGLALRLDQALGHIAEPLHSVVPPDHIAVAQRFAEPIASAEAIAHWLGTLVPRLVAALEAKGLGALRLELIADRIDGMPQRIRIGLARPNRDPAHLLRLLLRRIEQVEPGYGVDAVALHVRRSGPLGPEPIAERLDEEVVPDLAPLVDTLATRIGVAAMWRCRPVESDVPERSVARATVLDPPERTAPALRPDDVRLLDRNPALQPWHPAWPKPARLLRRPERLDHVLAELPDHAPKRFTWRGAAHRIVRSDGPERVHGEWWRHAAEQASVRDYFQVEDEAGRRYWLFRRGDGERAETGDLSWYLHGVFG